MNLFSTGVDHRRDDHQPGDVERTHQGGVGSPEIHFDVAIARLLVDRRDVVSVDEVEIGREPVECLGIADDQRQKPNGLRPSIDLPGEHLLAPERLDRPTGGREFH